MVGEPNLIRRPVIVAGGRIVLGFNQEKIDRLE
jgi:arsenate reductase-like glutaredoxin family protein